MKGKERKKKDLEKVDHNLYLGRWKKPLLVSNY